MDIQFTGSPLGDVLLTSALILINGLFVAIEFSLVRLRVTRIQELAEKGSKNAKLLEKVLDSLDHYLSATQFGITVVNLALGGLAEPIVAKMILGVLEVLPFQIFIGQSSVALHSTSYVISLLMISYFLVVFGELVPRSLGIRFAEFISLRTVRFLLIYRRVFYPFLSIFSISANAILRLIGVNLEAGQEKLTEEELRLILSSSLERGTLTDAKLDLLDNVFDFSKRTAKQIMVTRSEIVSLDISRSFDENLKLAKSAGHTRYPICDGSIDHVTGLINIKDLLWSTTPGAAPIQDLREIRREILFVPEGKPITRLLKDFQRNKIHMAVVIDEFGVTSGLVTLEDVLEELVGDIQDEYDQEVSRIQLLKDGSYLIDGSTLIEEVEDKLGETIEKGDNTTIGGVILTKLGQLPKVGDVAQLGNFSFVVKSLKGRRVHTIQAIRKMLKAKAAEQKP